MTTSRWTLLGAALVTLPLAILSLLAMSIVDVETAQKLFVNTTYYFIMATVLIWVGTYLHAARDLQAATVIAWLKENWPGLVIALTITVVAGCAVQPALRMLSDEANLVGTSKNFFSSKTATFTISGKNYYDSYWDIDVAIDRRPTLFPFLVSLIHIVRGYSYQNVFLFNLAVLPAFIAVSYRLAKSLGGELFAIVAAILVAAHPTTLLCVRSGGFDFFCVFFALLVIKSFFDFSRDRSPAKLAILWMNICMFAEIRYETALFVPPLLALLLFSRMVTWSTLRPYAFVYALTPAYFLPRIWQAILRGNIPEQEPGIVTFSFGNFIHNSSEYFSAIFSPLAFTAHSGVVIALGVLGCGLWLRWLWPAIRSNGWRAPAVSFAILIVGWMLLQAAISFTYFWGRAQYPSSARLLIALDTFFSFGAAWALTFLLRTWRPFVTVLLAVAVLVFYLPVASQHRAFNRLTQTRESATTWKFFERLAEKRILIVTDRPNLFTIMDYGAMNFEAARSDPYLLTAFARHLFYDVYVIQQLTVSTREPLPGYEIWSNRTLEPMLEFQNDANVSVRISRLAH